MPYKPLPPLPRQYNTVLHTSQHRVDLALKAQLQGLKGKLARAGIKGGKPATARQAQRAKAIMSSVNKSIWRDTGRIVAMNNYDAAVAAVNLQELTPVVRKEVLDQLVTAELNYTDISGIVSGAEETTLGWLDSLLGKIEGSVGQAAQQALLDWVNPDVTGGLSYSADRFAQDVLSNTFHDAQLETADVRGMTTVFWRLDSSHSVEDECDDYADQEFNIDEVPDIPHIGCLCFLEPGQQEDTTAYSPEVAPDQQEGPNAPTFKEMNQATIKGAVEVALKSTPEAVQTWAEFLRSSAGRGATVRVMQAPSGGFTYHVFK